MILKRKIRLNLLLNSINRGETMFCQKCNSIMSKGKFGLYCKVCANEREERIRNNGIKKG